jgi:hypothetical protein
MFVVYYWTHNELLCYFIRGARYLLFIVKDKQGEGEASLSRFYHRLCSVANGLDKLIQKTVRA